LAGGAADTARRKEAFREDAVWCRLEIFQELRMKFPGHEKVPMRTAALVAAGAVLVFSALAQQVPGSKAKKEERVLRATSRLVLVSAIVMDKDGEPVSGLTRDDFEVLEDGRPQSVATFSSVVSGAAPRALPAPAAPTAAVLPRNTFTNREERSHEVTPVITVILLDALNTEAKDSMYGQQEVVRFLQKLQPLDRVALYLLSTGGVRVLFDFTSDPAPLIRALQRYRSKEEPQVSASNPEADKSGLKEFDEFLRNTSALQSGFFLRDRVHRTVDALVAIADHLLRVPGRKNLVWVSGSFPISYGFDRLYASTRGTGASSADAASALGALAKGPEQPSGTSSGRGGRPTPQPPFASKDPDLLVSPEQEVFWRDLERAARALNQANLAIYPVDARGLMTSFPNPDFNPAAFAKGQGPNRPQFTVGGPDRQEFDTMNMLADRTGGRAFYNANEINQSVRMAIDESRVTYELGYYPVHNQWDGRFHEITVRLKRPGLRVRNRRGYFAVKDAPAAESQQGELLQAAADSPLESSALGLKVRLERVAGDARTLNLRIELDTREVFLGREGDRWVGALAVLVAQRKSDGERTMSGAQTVDLKLEQATYDKLLHEGMKLTKRIQLELGAEELRVVVRDTSSGATGSVYILLDRFREAPPQ
jgi:VWFA-related protein